MYSMGTTGLVNYNKEYQFLWLVASMREKRNVYRAVVGKLEGKRSVGRTRSRREDNTKMYFKEIRGEAVGLS